MKIRPSTQIMREGASSGDVLTWDGSIWTPRAPTGGGGTSGDPAGLTGATASTRYVGGTTSGSPTSGTFAVGDFVIAQDGYVWICVTAGSPGGWVRGDGVYFKDRFNRANSSPSMGAAWTADAGTWGITSNQAYCSSGVSGGAVVHDLGVADNYAIDFDISITTGSDMGLWFRYQDHNNAQLLAINPAASLTLFSVVAGSGTTLGSGGSPQDGDHYQVIVLGSSLTVKRTRSGTVTTEISVTDSTWNTQTKIGLRSQSDTVSRWDNLIVTRQD